MGRGRKGGGEPASASMPGLIILSENKGGAQLDALARRRVLGRSRIGERRVGSEARYGAVIARVEALEQQNFVRAHFRRIEPALAWIVDEIVSLAAPIARNAIGVDYVFWDPPARSAHAERRIQSRRVDRPPQIDDGDAAAKEFVGFV